jgi:hypothetical protein
MANPTGDINQDGVVNAIDLSLLVSMWGGSDADADLNNDGVVNAIDLSILVSNWGETGSPPTAPAGLSATAGDAEVSLTWSSVSDADTYNIKRSTSSGGSYGTIQTGLTTTNYTDTNLINDTTYYYIVSAVNSHGESANSSQASATPIEGGTGPIDDENSTLLYDFNDGTVQGWVPGWTIEENTVTLANVNNQLRTTGSTTQSRPGELRMRCNDGGQLNDITHQGEGNVLSAEVTLSPDLPAGEFGCDVAWQAQDWSWKVRWDPVVQRMDTGAIVSHLVPGVGCLVSMDFTGTDPIVEPRAVEFSPTSSWTNESSGWADIDNVRRSVNVLTVGSGGDNGGDNGGDPQAVIAGWSGNDEHENIRRDITASWANRESWDDLENAHWFGFSPNGAWHWLNDGNYDRSIFLNIGLIPHNYPPGEWEYVGRKQRWDDLLDEAISGNRDYVYEGMGARLSDYGSKNVYCVLWWEMNQHHNDVDIAKFKAAWARAVPIIRSAFAARAVAEGRTDQTIHITYSPMHSGQQWWERLPDDPSLVDVIGCNIYAKEWFNNPPTYQQVKDVVDGDLAKLKAKADELGKPMALPEWANWSATSGASAGQYTSRGLGDEPDVIDWFADWAEANGAIICYFDIDHGDGVLWLNEAPLTKARMEQRFPR